MSQASNPTTPNPATPTSAKPKLTPLQQLACAWPVGLVIVGGAIGGLCGGAAWAINTRIMASALPAPLRYGLCVLTGLAAAIVWYFAALPITPMIASMFGPR